MPDPEDSTESKLMNMLLETNRISTLRKRSVHFALSRITLRSLSVESYLFWLTRYSGGALSYISQRIWESSFGE